MSADAIHPGHCFARAHRLLGEVRLVREELGRSEDNRSLPEMVGAAPRDCYFEAIAAWHKAERLGEETGARSTRAAPAAPAFPQLRPMHVLTLIDGVLAHVEAVKQRLGITESTTEMVVEGSRQPSDVLMILMRVNREISRTLERPFSPTDVYRVVALASAYASRLTTALVPAPDVPFERRRRPADCYHLLEVCLAKVGAIIARNGGSALQARGTPTDIQPGDVYDLANLVLGEVAYLHSLTADAPCLHAFEPVAAGYCLPAHVYQIARTLEVQLA